MSKGYLIDLIYIVAIVFFIYTVVSAGDSFDLTQTLLAGLLIIGAAIVFNLLRIRGEIVDWRYKDE